MSSPRFCYIVMCHTDREGLARALRRIRELSPQAQIVVRPDGPGLVTSQLLAEVGATAVDSDVRITWGFRPLREPGLAMVFWAAQARGGGSLHNPALPPRTG